MNVVIGIDGGGTKTEACVVTADGEVLGFGSSGGANWETVGLQAMGDAVAVATQAALGAAGLGWPNVAAWACCLAGVDWPSDEARILPQLAAVAPTPPVVLANDAFASLRAGAPAGVGLVSVAGTGGVTAGRDRHGRMARTMGLGIGEGGGAGAITRGALRALARYHHGQADGGQELAAALCAALGCADLAGLFEGVSRGGLRVEPEHARVVLDLADAGDPLAIAVTARQAAQHAADVAGVAARLGLLEEVVTVVAAGGVHVRTSPSFSDTFAAAVRSGLPGATVRVLEAPPAVGAALLALDVLDGPAPDGAEREARDARTIGGAARRARRTSSTPPTPS